MDAPSDSQASQPSGLTLPIELILNIIELTIEQDRWKLTDCLLISKGIRTVLLRSVTLPDVHLYSPDQLDRVLHLGWPPLSSGATSSQSNKGVVSKSGRVGGKEKSLPNLRSLYLHFIEYHNQIDFYRNLVKGFNRLSQRESQDVIETLGVRLGDFDYEDASVSLGLWICTIFKHLKRLYVDSSMMPPFNADCNQHDPSSLDFPEVALNTPTNSLESFAFSDSSDTSFIERMESIRYTNVFSTVQRFYLFTHMWDTKAWQRVNKTEALQEDLAWMATAFDCKTMIRYIANIVVCPKEAERGEEEKVAPMIVYPNGLVIFKLIIVRAMPEVLDVLGLMNRVIDDIEEEWAPQAFRGRNWYPQTRPYYIKTIPTVNSAGCEEGELLLVKDHFSSAPVFITDPQVKTRVKASILRRWEQRFAGP